MNLVRHVVDSVSRYWADEVQILGIWEDGPATVCVVYRRTVDPKVSLGWRLEFTADSADGTVEGFARDVAVNLAEPIGTARSRQDQHGIVWVAAAEGHPTPEPPADVLQRVVTS